MLKTTVYREQLGTYPAPQFAPKNPPTRDRISELQKTIFELRRTINIITEKVDDLSLTIDNFVPKEMLISGQWNVNAGGIIVLSFDGTINIKSLKDTITITCTIPEFVYMPTFSELTFTSEDTIPEETLESKLNIKEIPLDDGTVTPFILTTNPVEGVLLTLKQQVGAATSVAEGDPCLFKPLFITYIMIDE